MWKRILLFAALLINFDQTWRGLEKISQEYEGKLLILIINNIGKASDDDVKRNVDEMYKGRCPPFSKDCQFSLMANHDTIFAGNCQEIAEILENNFPSIQLFVEFPIAIFTTDSFRDVRHDFCAIRFYVEELLKKYYGNDPQPKVCVFLPINGMLIKNIHHFTKLVHVLLVLKCYKKAQINIEELMVLLVHLTKLNLDFLNQMVNDYYSCKKIIQYLIMYLRRMNVDGFLPTREEWDHHICFNDEPGDDDYLIEKKPSIIQCFPSCQGCGKKSGYVITLCEIILCLDLYINKKVYKNDQQLHGLNKAQ
uniref:Uncharacterized protein n=1 Tax=Panagrolaimus sp. JU765 TaxID=591449 RepID=A0AC34Q0U0_9BILA